MTTQNQTTTEPEQSTIDPKELLAIEIEEYRQKCAARNAGLPEAGGIAFTTVYIGSVPINVTQRALTAYDALAQLWKGLDLARQAMGITFEKPLPPPATPARPNAAAEAVRDENPKLANQIEQQALTLPDPPAGKVWQETVIASIKILPQPSDKITVEFYESGMKFAALKANKWTVERVKTLLVPVTSADVTKAAEYTLPCKVYWTEGKEFPADPQGRWQAGHYKDIGAVRPV